MIDDAVGATQNVLASMTAGIMARKNDRAATLTPVGYEAGAQRPLPERIPAMFPNDHPLEAIDGAIAAIRREIGYILKALDAIEEAKGAPPPAPPAKQDLEAAARELEREQDAKFAADLAEKQAAAQAQVFTKDAGPAAPKTSWACPTHGRKAISVQTSRKGRVYGACTECKEFEK